MFQFYLNDILVNDPIDWDKFEETISHDDQLKIVLPKYDVKLTFSSDGYEYLSSMLYENGYCKLIPIIVKKKNENDNYVTILEGYIFISDCVFNRNKCLVEVQIIDNNFGARIYNNKEIKTYLNSGKSKNGISITNADVYLVDFFKPTVGGYSGDLRALIFWYDAFRFLIDFVSDGNVGFESNYLNYNILENIKNDNANKVALVTGFELRNFDHSTSPFISFAELFAEVNKKFPIMATIIKGNDGRPTLKIENEDYFYSQTNSINIENPIEVKESFDSEKLYANIKFGGEFKKYDGVLYDFPETRFFSFQDEEYYFQSECNINKTLDLQADYICDANVIQGVIETDTTNDGYDDKIFLIECEELYPTLLAKVTESPITGGLPWYYNSNLQNNKIAERYNLSSAIALYLNNGGDDFMASNIATQTLVASGSPFYVNTSTPFISVPIAFQDDSTPPNEDPNNNYNNTLFKYTSPANGVYAFEVELIMDIMQLTVSGLRAQIIYEVFDASNTLIFTNISASYFDLPLAASASFTMKFNDSIYIPSSNYTNIKLKLSNKTNTTIATTIGQLRVLNDSYWKTTAVDNGGGVYEYKDPANYFVSKVEFEYPISDVDYNKMKDDLSKGVLLVNDWGNYNIWAKNIKRVLSTGETKFEMISNLNNTTY